MEEAVVTGALFSWVDHRHLKTRLAFFSLLVADLLGSFGRFRHLQIGEGVVVHRMVTVLRGPILLRLRIILGRLVLNRGGTKEPIDTLVDLIRFRVQHDDVVGNVLIRSAKSRQLVRVFVFSDLRVGGQELLEGVHGLVHALLQELALVEEGGVGDVLEDVSVVDHFLERLHA